MGPNRSEDVPQAKYQKTEDQENGRDGHNHQVLRVCKLDTAFYGSKESSHRNLSAAATYGGAFTLHLF